MHLRFRTSYLVYGFLLAVSLAGASYVAYRIVGFLGVGVLGLIIGVIAQNVELERGRPVVHGQAASLYVQLMAAEERMPEAERAERRAEIEGAAWPLFVAKAVGAVLAVAGFGLFFAVQLGA